MIIAIKKRFNSLMGLSAASNDDYINEKINLFTLHTQKRPLAGFIESFAGKSPSEAYFAVASRLCLLNLCEELDVPCPVLRVVSKKNQITMLAAFPLKDAHKLIAAINDEAGERAARKIERIKLHTLWENRQDEAKTEAALNEIQYPMLFCLTYRDCGIYISSAFELGEFDCKATENITAARCFNRTHERGIKYRLTRNALGRAFIAVGHDRLVKIFRRAEIARKRATVWRLFLTGLFLAPLVLLPADMAVLKAMFSDWQAFVAGIRAMLNVILDNNGYLLDQAIFAMCCISFAAALCLFANGLKNHFLKFVGLKDGFTAKAKKIADEIVAGASK